MSEQPARGQRTLWLMHGGAMVTVTPETACVGSMSLAGRKLLGSAAREWVQEEALPCITVHWGSWSPTPDDGFTLQYVSDSPSLLLESHDPPADAWFTLEREELVADVFTQPIGSAVAVKHIMAIAGVVGAPDWPAEIVDDVVAVELDDGIVLELVVDGLRWCVTRYDPGASQLLVLLRSDASTDPLATVLRVRLRFHDGTEVPEAFDVGAGLLRPRHARCRLAAAPLSDPHVAEH